MYFQGKKISVSLASVEFVALGKDNEKGSKLIVTEQHAFLDGYEDSGNRERGTLGLIDNLGVALAGGDVRVARGRRIDAYWGGYNDPRYATTSIISLSVSFSTTGVICCAASLARVPLRNASICRSR